MISGMNLRIRIIIARYRSVYDSLYYVVAIVVVVVDVIVAIAVNCCVMCAQVRMLQHWTTPTTTYVVPMQ